jgi:hypothetical protein
MERPQTARVRARRACAAALIALSVLLAGCSTHGEARPKATVTVNRVAAAPPAALNGFGATDAIWNATHSADTHFARSGSDPSPALTLADRRRYADVYTDVVHRHGRVVGYTVRILPGNAAEPAARRQVLGEFPSDAVVRWLVRKAACAQLGVQSARLGRVLSSRAFGDSRGMVLAELESVAPDGTNTYSPRRVTDAILSLGPGSGAASARGC